MRLTTARPPFSELVKRVATSGDKSVKPMWRPSPLFEVNSPNIGELRETTNAERLGEKVNRMAKKVAFSRKKPKFSEGPALMIKDKLGRIDQGPH